MEDFGGENGLELMAKLRKVAMICGPFFGKHLLFRDRVYAAGWADAGLKFTPVLFPSSIERRHTGESRYPEFLDSG